MESVRQQVRRWLSTKSLDPRDQAQIDSIWTGEIPRDQVLAKFLETVAIADPQAQQLVDHCSQVAAPKTPPDLSWVRTDSEPTMVHANLRYVYGRWLAQQGQFDECLEEIDSLEPDDVLDPAGLLFYQSISHHRLVQPLLAQKKLTRLLDRKEELPRRYAQLGHLMQLDLGGLKEDSLDHIARRMSDVRRRLGLGRANSRVREIEDGVIASLDKLIEQIESQQQQTQGSGGGNSPQSGQPMQDSRIGLQKAPGKVDHRDIGHKSGWGALPDKAREAAMQQIGRDFPSHYRDVIEEYFKKLAREEE